MSMSVMLTSSSEDLSKIQATVDILDFVIQFSKQNTTISTADKVYNINDLLSLHSYYHSIYNILTTAGMTLEDYKESLL